MFSFNLFSLSGRRLRGEEDQEYLLPDGLNRANWRLHVRHLFGSGKVHLHMSG